MKKHVNITYQVMGRQQITQNMIHDYRSRIIYLGRYIYIYIYNDYLIEYM